MPKRVAIVGGGLAGISAAVHLAAAGFSCTLFEKRPYLGGRASSFRDPETGWMLDNGPHLLVGAYHATGRLLKMIGSAEKIHFQPRLTVLYFDVEKGWAKLKTPQLPSPLHWLAAMAQFRFLSPTQRLTLLQAMWKLKKMPEASALDKIALSTWLETQNQSPAARRFFWDVLTLATLNAPAAKISLLNFHRVLHRAFFSGKKNARLGWATDNLAAIFARPAEAFLAKRGTRILKGEPINEIKTTNSRVTQLVGKGGKTTEFDWVILALPPEQTTSLLADTPLQRKPLSGAKPSPIVTAHVLLKREIFSAPFLALIGGTAQWIFNLNAMRRKPEWKGFGYSLVISGADQEAAENKEKFMQKIIGDLKKIQPQLTGDDVLHRRIVKEMHATYIFPPGGERGRPGVETSFSNLFLAGGWTLTGLPDTIESAVTSGEQAARKLMRL